MSVTTEPRQSWEGPFEGYIKGTPKDFTGKTKITFCSYGKVYDSFSIFTMLILKSLN